MPDSEVIVHSNFQVDDNIKLEISRLFNNDLTAEEIRDLDDNLIMNDLLNRGDYELKTGNKSRFRYRAKDKKPSGAAGVSFVSAAATVAHFDRAENQKREEDDELLIGESNKRTSREDEDLELLGLLD